MRHVVHVSVLTMALVACRSEQEPPRADPPAPTASKQSATGTLSGTLIVNGLGQRLVPGYVRLIGRHSYATYANDRGAWTITVPVGEYRVIGTSPVYGQYLCDGPSKVVITQTPQSGAKVLCEVK